MNKNNQGHVHVIGIGDDGPVGLTAHKLELIRKTDFLAGGERHLEFFPEFTGEKLVVKSNLRELLEILQKKLDAGKASVVLASGDPMFHGIGGYLSRKLPKESLSILPHMSSMQLAFSAAQVPWEKASLVSVHGKPMENLLEPARSADVIGVFTEDGSTPAKIASYLIERNLNSFEAVVCERLGNEGQTITRLPLADLREKSFDDLNTLILIRVGETPKLRYPIGFPDESFAQRKPDQGLITKSEIRTLSLAKLGLSPYSVVWDVGAGSGSVSIEAALLCPAGHVYAIEKNEHDIVNVRENIRRYHAANVIPIHARAPDCFKDIPADPDAVFIGGSSGSMFDILQQLLQRLSPGGRIVVNLATVENLAETLKSVQELELEFDLTQVQISRGKAILNMTRFVALNPVYIIAAWRPTSGGSAEADMTHARNR